MRIDGKNYYLTRDESFALATNDIHPNKEALQRRDDFFQEIDRTFLDIYTDQKGDMFARVDGLDEVSIINALNQEDFPESEYDNKHCRGKIPFGNKEIAQIVIEEPEKAGVKYSFGPGGVQFSGFQSTDGKDTYYEKKCHFTRGKSLTFLEYKNDITEVSQHKDAPELQYMNKQYKIKVAALLSSEKDELCGDWNSKSSDENDLSFVAA